MANPRRDLLTKLIAREIEKQQQQQKKTKQKTKQKLQSQKITEQRKTIIMTLSKTLNTHTTTVYARLISLPLRHMLEDFYFLYNFRKICIRIF